jgi:hypothetical protein
MSDITDADKLEALKCAYRAGAADWVNRTAIDRRAEIHRARKLLGLPDLDSLPAAPWTMELSKLVVRRGEKDGKVGLLVSGLVSVDAGIYVFVPLDPDAGEKGMDYLLNILSADLTNAFDSILWMWNNPEEAEREGCLDQTSSTRIRAWREKVDAEVSLRVR